MKYSLSVCEFNPLHNGHVRLINEMKAKGDRVILIMSGNFCQRGEAAVLNKHARARHAILAGADMVLELPAVFASQPAEIFAKGAVKLLSSISGEKTLFFGTEAGEKEDFLKVAEALSKESKEFKKVLKTKLSEGLPFAEAREKALEETEDIDLTLLKTPNAVLGLEYSKAIKFFGSDMDICPIKRDGDFNDSELKGEYCSSLAIREAIAIGKRKKAKGFLPSYVYGDLPEALPDMDELSIYAVLRASGKDLRQITDCTEGLENRVKVIARECNDRKTLIDRLETRRYTRARISRIITNNMLGITHELTEKCLKSNLYLKVLAIREDRKDLLSIKTGKTPFITRKNDADRLDGTAKECFMKDVFACELYSLMTGSRLNEYEMKIVK